MNWCSTRNGKPLRQKEKVSVGEETWVSTDVVKSFRRAKDPLRQERQRLLSTYPGRGMGVEKRGSSDFWDRTRDVLT